MRILSIGSLPPRSGGLTHGGVATFHASLLAGLAPLRGSVEVVGVVPPAPLEHDIGLPVFTRPSDRSTADFYEDLLGRLRPDAVLMNHFAHTIGVTHAQLRPAAPAVGIAHSWHQITQRSGDQRTRAAEVTDEALAGLHALVAGSRHCLREGDAMGLQYPPTAEVIHYPLQPFYTEPDIGVSARSRRGIAYLGSLISRKNPVGLAEAAAKLPGQEVCFAGHGELEQPLRRSIESLGLADRVRIAHLADFEVRELLLRSQVMCLPSRSETFGLAYIEALACGTPVVGFGPTIREIRDEMGVDIGEPLDSGGPEEIATALENVIAADWDREALRRATIDAFGLAGVSQRYIELLCRVVGSMRGIAARNERQS